MAAVNREVSWDPLEEKPTTELVGAAIKRQIKNILKSYTGYYDLFSELIQNSLDALDERKKIERTDYIPSLWITINLRENYIALTDNGIGFKREEFRSFLAPNISFKVGNTRGNKGVGATYLAYGFNFLQVGTKSDEFNYIGTIRGGKEWVDDPTITKTRPLITPDPKAIHKPFGSIDRGSTFVLKLTGENIRPKDLNYIGASDADQWEKILKVKSPLGGLYFDRECTVKKCYLEVIDSTDTRTFKEVEAFSYLFPHIIAKPCTSLKEVVDKQRELVEKNKDTSRLPSSFYNLNGIWQIWEPEDLIGNRYGISLTLKPKELECVRNFKIRMYSFQTYSTDLWDSINDDFFRLRKGSRIIKGGIQLATNSMPQGELQIIPLTKNVGLQNTTHVVIHFSSADPDLGRKGFQPELLKLAQKIAAASVSPLRHWNKLLRPDTGAPPSIEAEKVIDDWVSEQVEHEKEKPLLIKRNDIFLPTTEPSITSEPCNEQDVIALFNQLLAGGVIRSIKIMATHQSRRYDGIFRIIIKEPLKNHIYDKESNPLGALKTTITKELTSKPYILEYKYNLDALLEEFETGDKVQKDINLVIAWEMGEDWGKRYTVFPLLHFSNLQHRPFHGCTHILNDATRGDFVFYAIILKELINYINDPDSVQEFQKTTYLDEK